MHTVFISHATQDTQFAHHLADDLRRLGVRVWIAPESIRPGEGWVSAIERGLEESSHMVVVLTPAALKSKWVKKETEVAIARERKGLIQVIPLDVEPCKVPPLLSSYQMVSFRRDYDAGLRRLADILGVHVTPPEPVAALAEEAMPPFWQKVPLQRWGIVGWLVLLLAVVGGVLLVGRGEPTPAPVAVETTTPTATVPLTATPVPLTAYPTYIPVPTDTPIPPMATPTFIPPPTPTSVVPPTDTPTPVPPTPTPVPPTDTPTPVPPTPTPVPPTAIPIVPTPTPHLIGKIAYVMSDGIYVMDADGSNGGIVYEGSVRMSTLSPDGNKIGFSRKDGLWVMNVNGSGLQQIVSSDGISSLAWSPDSKQIVYSQGRGPAGEGYIVEIPHGIPQPLGGWIYDPDWSPDGWLVYYTFQGMVKRQVSGGPISVLDSNVDWLEGQPAWSPDGTRIVYSEGADILVINADGSGQTKLTDDPANDWDPCWSPDGSKIAFITDRDVNSEIYVMNPDGSNQMNLTNSAENEWQPTWAP
jgi:hypothetical protein